MFLPNRFVCVFACTLSLTDLLLPVAGDPAADLVSAVVAGGLPQAVAAVVLVGDTLAIARLGRRALGGRSSFVMFATCGGEGGWEGRRGEQKSCEDPLSHEKNDLKKKQPSSVVLA